MSTDKVSIPRLKRVRFKSGGSMEVVRPKIDGDILFALKKTIATAATIGSEPVGYACVVWTEDGTVIVNYKNSEKSPLTSGQVPGYVKDVLLADTAGKWLEK